MLHPGRKCYIQVENVIRAENSIKVENATSEVENATSW